MPAGIEIYNYVTNQKGSPAIWSDLFAARPPAGFIGRLFVSTDTFEIYRDTGSGWDLIGGPGSSTVTGSGAAGQVTYWDGSNSVSGESAFTYNSANNNLRLDGNLSINAAQYGWANANAVQVNNFSLVGATGGSSGDLVLNAYYDGSDYRYNTSNTAWRLSLSSSNAVLTRALSGTAGNTISWITGLVLDDNSRLGVWTGPSAWLSNYGVVQLPFGGSFYSRSNGTTVGITSNAYLDNVGAGFWQYFSTGTAARYEMNNNNHRWFVAPSGSGAITFTQAMTLFDTGDLALGQTTDAGFKLDVNGTARFSGSISVQNVAIGIGAGSVGTNTRVGQTTLIVNTTGSFNTAIGNAALAANTTGTSNSALGANALSANTIGEFNTAIGSLALLSNGSGSNNTSLGFQSSYFNSNGSNNVAIGVNTLQNCTSGNSHTFIGVSAGRNLTTSNNNIGIGVNAGRYAGSGTTINQTSSNSAYIGYQTRASASGNTNEVVIGYDVVGLGSNTTVLGNASTVTTGIYGNLLLGTTTDSGNKLRVNGTIRIDGQTAATAGGSAGLHLIVNCDGTNYKIALLNV